MGIDIKDFKVYEVDYVDRIPTSEIKWITGLMNVVEFDGTDFKEHAQFRDWCLENCDDKVVFVEKSEDHFANSLTIILYFYKAEDALAAKLRWS